jgi:hypothetical protein
MNFGYLMNQNIDNLFVPYSSKLRKEREAKKILSNLKKLVDIWQLWKNKVADQERRQLAARGIVPPSNGIGAPPSRSASGPRPHGIVPPSNGTGAPPSRSTGSSGPRPRGAVPPLPPNNAQQNGLIVAKQEEQAAQQAANAAQQAETAAQQAVNNNNQIGLNNEKKKAQQASNAAQQHAARAQQAANIAAGHNTTKGPAQQAANNAKQYATKARQVATKAQNYKISTLPPPPPLPPSDPIQVKLAAFVKDFDDNSSGWSVDDKSNKVNTFMTWWSNLDTQKKKPFLQTKKNLFTKYKNLAPVDMSGGVQIGGASEIEKVKLIIKNIRTNIQITASELEDEDDDEEIDDLTNSKMLLLQNLADMEKKLAKLEKTSQPSDQFTNELNAIKKELCVIITQMVADPSLAAHKGQLIKHQNDPVLNCTGQAGGSKQQLKRVLQQQVRSLQNAYSYKNTRDLVKMASEQLSRGNQTERNASQMLTQYKRAVLNAYPNASNVETRICNYLMN